MGTSVRRTHLHDPRERPQRRVRRDDAPRDVPRSTRRAHPRRVRLEPLFERVHDAKPHVQVPAPRRDSGPAPAGVVLRVMMKHEPLASHRLRSTGRDHRAAGLDGELQLAAGRQRGNRDHGAARVLLRAIPYTKKMFTGQLKGDAIKC